MRVETKKGQTWSFDLIVAVIVFIVVVGIFYSLLNRSNEVVVDTQALEANAKSISHQLNCDVSPIHPPCFIENGEVNDEKLAVVAALSYDELKEFLGTNDDFCIYIMDEENRVIPITDEDGDITPGIGSGSYVLGGGLGCNTVI